MSNFFTILKWALAFGIGISLTFAPVALSNTIVDSSHPPQHVNENVRSGGDDLDPPLILTPLINSGNINEAQNLSRVHLSDVFNPEKAPLLLWLNGGPGASSMLGLFTENGPFIIDSAKNWQYRSTSWSLTHSVIYIDSPVGTGFSFTEDEAGYANTEEDVTKGLYSALTQFFKLFPSYQANNFFLTGESYAGKYLPNLAWKIHEENNRTPEVKINLQGMAIGDAFTDPENMMEYSSILYTIGLLDSKQKADFVVEEEKIAQLIQAKNWTEAFYVFDSLVFGAFSGKPSLFKKYTGFDFFYNFMLNSEPKDFRYYVPFLSQPSVRQAIHVGNATFNDMSLIVRKHMKNVILQSAAPTLTALLDAPEKYQILIYNGQFDICVANMFIENVLGKLPWHGATKFAQSEKKIWKVGKDLAGYVKVTDNLTYLLIRNAGHIVPYDQPKWSFDMINRFTSGKRFSKK